MELSLKSSVPSCDLRKPLMRVVAGAKCPPFLSIQQTGSLAGSYRCISQILLHMVSDILDRWDEGPTVT